MTTFFTSRYKKVGGAFFKFSSALRTPSSFLSIILLAVAISMTASVTTDEKPCCKEGKPCCKEAKPCCQDTTKTDTLQLHMEKNQNPQL